MKLTAIILAAGRGERMGAGTNKILLPLAGRPVLSYALEMWLGLAESLLIVAQRGDWPQIRPLIAPYGEKTRLVAGGECRAASLKQAIRALDAEDGEELLAIHDGARPLTALADIGRVIEAAKLHGGAILAARVTDTIRYEGEDGFCGPLIPRERLLAAQTPQIFRRDWLEAAYEAVADEELPRISDDAALLQAQGYSCAYVIADNVNLKLTKREDIVVAEALIGER